MADYTDLDPTLLRASVSDGTNLKPSLTTSSYAGGTPAAAADLKPSIAYADGTLKESIADADGVKANWLLVGSARPPAGAGKLGQLVYAEVGKVTTTTQIPADDTTPQNTEGGELITASITPTDANSKLVIIVSGQVSNSANTYNTAICLFKDSDADAIGVYRMATTVMHSYEAIFVVDAFDTSARTYKIRFGANGAGTCRSYSASADDDGGLTNLTTLTIEEMLI